MKIKRLLALVLSLVMLFSAVAPVAFAAAKNSQYPIIIIVKMHTEIFQTDPVLEMKQPVSEP